MVLESALLCLTLNIFHEARGESVVGQYAVAEVTMQRAGHDQRKVCREVYKPAQFSWTLEPQGNAKQIDPDAYHKARQIAKMVLLGRVPAGFFTGGATHYHAVHVKPYWSSYLVHTKRIESHVFYR